MARRGPDGEGCYGDDSAALGHRRLAIIDLSESGKQPMQDCTGRYVITFNGEIYNYRDLRRELELAGAKFRSRSDTEVILEGYKAWGTQAFSRLNGMFALALWDTVKRQLVLARDRLGKKPLYYSVLADGGVIFGSEQKALLLDPCIPRAIRPRALAQYLSLGYTLTDECFVDGIEKLAPGCFMVIEQGKQARSERYWDVAPYFREKCSLPDQEAVAALLALLENATQIRMISDVPIGAFLSGGVDSSSIVAAMCRVPDAPRVSTFSIGFEEPTYSELAEAEAVAAALGTEHRGEIVHAQMSSVLDSIVHAADEPFADNSMIPCYFLARFAREKVTVALSGDGGDEIFAGYETYRADRLHRRLTTLPRPLVAAAVRLANISLPVSFDKVSFDFKLRRFLQSYQLSFPEAHTSWRLYFGESDRQALLQPEVADATVGCDALSLFRESFAAVPDLHYLDQAMYVDLQTWLASDILVKADRMSMAHGLEVRCPLLDHRVVEFAASLPISQKVRGGVQKYLLKESQRKYLPKNIIDRKKRGFNAPIAHWIVHEMRHRIETASDSQSALASVVRPEAIRGLLEDHLARRCDNSLQLYNLLVLDSWMRQSGIVKLSSSG